MEISTCPKKISWLVVVTGAAVGIGALVLTALGNPANMGFCIACFLRDIAGATKLHTAAAVQYARPEIIGLVLGSFIMSRFQPGIQGQGRFLSRHPLYPGCVRDDRGAGIPRLPAFVWSSAWAAET